MKGRLDLDVIAVPMEGGADSGILEQVLRRTRKRRSGFRPDRGGRDELSIRFAPSEAPAKTRQLSRGRRAVGVALSARPSRERSRPISYRPMCSGRHQVGFDVRVGPGGHGDIERRPWLGARLRTRSRLRVFGRRGKGHRTDRNSSFRKPP